MLEQGPSKNTNLMEWDKLWAMNKKFIDPISGKYTAISLSKISTIQVLNLSDEEDCTITIPLHQQVSLIILIKNNLI